MNTGSMPITAPSLSPMQLALRRVDQLTGLLEVGRALNAAPGLEVLLTLLLKESARGAEAEQTALFVLGADGQLQSAGGTLRVQVGQGLIGAAAKGTVVMVRSVKEDARFAPATDGLGAAAVASFLAAPARDRSGKVIGVLAAVHSSEDHFKGEAAELFDAMAGLAAAALR
jgi:GAF domain-containing protein